VEVSCSYKLHNSSIGVDSREWLGMKRTLPWYTPFIGAKSARAVFPNNGNIPKFCRGTSALAWPPDLAPQRAGAVPLSTPASMLRCANCSRFGPSDPFSKLLKFFKLLGQCLGPKTQRREQKAGRLNAVTQLTLLNKTIQLALNSH
jgi:hypothetical protein